MRCPARNILLIAFATILLLFSYGFYTQRRSHESSEFATVSWTVGGKPMEARVTIVDADRDPAPVGWVRIDNDSGGGGAQTDSQGVAVIKLAEPEMLGIVVNDVRVVDRHSLDWLGAPDVSKGLIINVKLKRREHSGHIP
jgi:hypothetical protein